MMLEHRQILICGLTEEQNEQIIRAVPVKGYSVVDVTDAPTDLLAAGAAVLIVEDTALDEEIRQSLFSMYEELDGCSYDTLLFIGSPRSKEEQRLKGIKWFDTFDDLVQNLKYHLLTAHKKMKGAVDFSRKISYGIQILSMIRSSPGITSKKIADATELSVRTVQRYIAALQSAGEWIEYDPKSRGWRLQYGMSILFGDWHADMR